MSNPDGTVQIRPLYRCEASLVADALNQGAFDLKHTKAHTGAGGYRISATILSDLCEEVTALLAPDTPGAQAESPGLAGTLRWRTVRIETEILRYVRERPGCLEGDAEDAVADIFGDDSGDVSWVISQLVGRGEVLDSEGSLRPAEDVDRPGTEFNPGAAELV